MSEQTDNTNAGQKIRLRRWVAENFDRLNVLDLYCGAGVMYDGIWHEAETYLGVDKYKPHKKARTIALSAEEAAQFLPLDTFNVFDIDPYDSPWIVARAVMKRVAPGRYGMCLTSGEERSLREGNVSNLVRVICGLQDLGPQLWWLCNYRVMLIGLLLRNLSELDGITLEHAVKTTTERHIAYIGLIFNKR